MNRFLKYLLLVPLSGCLFDSAKDGTGIQVSCNQANQIRQNYLADILNRCGAEFGSTFTDYPDKSCQSGSATLVGLSDSKVSIQVGGVSCALLEKNTGSFFMSAEGTSYSELVEGSSNLKDFWIDDRKYSVSDATCVDILDLIVSSSQLKVKFGTTDVISCN